MPSFEKTFAFNSSPFEQYVAENEPDILSYAVVPPYYDVAKRRAATPSTHILFGARGSGKSATRLSTERELWKRHSDGEHVPLVVSMVNFSRLLDGGRLEDVTSDGLIKELAFCVIETLLLWISDQDEGYDFIEILQPDELTLLLALSKAFYLQVPETGRQISQDVAMRLLHQNWRSQTRIWINKKWSEISHLIANISSGLAQKHADTKDLTGEISSLLTSKGNITSGVTVLSKLVELSRVFGFHGISVFVDKVDEHPKTQASPESSSKLIFPILSHIQLMEVEGLGWQFFLWDRIRTCLTHGPLAIRLDKIAHSEVSWTEDFLRAMLDARVKFFSAGRIEKLSELSDGNYHADTKIGEAIDLSVFSPRELIRLFDTVSREYDSKHSSKSEMRFLSIEDFDAGMDKYVSDVIWSIYDKRILSQMIRLDREIFVNSEVQKAFKISPPGATNRIVKWEAAGAVALTGKRDAEGGGGGKPSNEYSVIDPRIIRLAKRNLYDKKI